MIHIKLPDNSVRSFDHPLTAGDVAAHISPSLLKEALVARVDDNLVDLSHSITKDSTVEIITRKHLDALEIIRHDTTHLLAEAAKELYGKDIQITIGPAIENDFYYDIAKEHPFSPEDLEALEQKMREIVDRNEPFIREEWAWDEAIGEHYKTEIVSLYRQGDFLDLCRGTLYGQSRQSL